MPSAVQGQDDLVLARASRYPFDFTGQFIFGRSLNRLGLPFVHSLYFYRGGLAQHQHPQSRAQREQISALTRDAGDQDRAAGRAQPHSNGQIGRSQNLNVLNFARQLVAHAGLQAETARDQGLTCEACQNGVAGALELVGHRQQLQALRGDACATAATAADGTIHQRCLAEVGQRVDRLPRRLVADAGAAREIEPVSPTRRNTSSRLSLTA